MIVRRRSSGRNSSDAELDWVVDVRPVDVVWLPDDREPEPDPDPDPDPEPEPSLDPPPLEFSPPDPDDPSRPFVPPDPSSSEQSSRRSRPFGSSSSSAALAKRDEPVSPSDDRGDEPKRAWSPSRVDGRPTSDVKGAP